MKAFLIFEFRFASSIKPAFPVACFVFRPHPPLVGSFSPSFAPQKPAKEILQMGSLAPWQLPLQNCLLSTTSTLQGPDARCNIFQKSWGKGGEGRWGERRGDLYI